MIWPLWFLTPKSNWQEEQKKKSIYEWLSRAIGCNTSYSEHVLKREHNVQIHVQLLPVTLKQSLISSVLSECVCWNTAMNFPNPLTTNFYPFPSCMYKTAQCAAVAHWQSKTYFLSSDYLHPIWTITKCQMQAKLAIRRIKYCHL